MSQFQYLITVSPLGFMYGSAGAFLSPENLVGRSGSKFPPDTAAIAGLFFNANRESQFVDRKILRDKLVVAGPFWAKEDKPKQFYIPIPWHKVISEEEDDEWVLVKKPKKQETVESNDEKWCLGQHQWHRQNKDLKPEYSWQLIDNWNLPANELRENREEHQAIAKAPWDFVSFLHPKIKNEERHVVEKDGLFLENAVQLNQEYCLVYLSNYELPNGWYRFGGEGHLVEIQSHALPENHKINRLLSQKIQHAFALIVPGVWGSNKLSYRYPYHPDFPRKGLKILTDKAVPYRYRLGSKKKEGEVEILHESDDPKKEQKGRLSRGRYAVPAGSVYVFKHPLNLTWWDFPDEWFPKEGFPLKHLGCGLCLPIDIQGVE
ncbi:type III-B CRISPR module-associated Cmr3 family protein [Kamptonema animale CS-326]|jgi:CRISPR-associated protein Cmr3|uniref:type III-B CRISPR module-associated Cmr3 family protein n=1 Tax=Kamptonema animale TaxID=92934 RepID=UPI00232C0B1B|nr:type III-B CRISPR module-associated Cmr3 family protein [Kamptonema animale]MDB9510889.1 type III-B CRISPR module-associated Cmr3 family protein [Kamptonema animale CS-326]